MFRGFAKAFSEIGWRDDALGYRKQQRAKIWDRFLQSTAIVGGGLAVTGTGYLLANERIADRQGMFVLLLGAIAALIIGAATFSLAARIRMAQYVGQVFGPIKAGMTICLLWVLAASLMMGGFGALIVAAFLALAPLAPPPPPPVETTPPAEKTGPLKTSSPAKSSNPVISGAITHIVDGDTFDIGSIRIRPLGYDTPEAGAKCESAAGIVDVYRQATEALSGLTVGKVISCEDTGKRDRDGRTIARCMVGDDDIASYLVAQGWGRDWPEYSGGAYCPQEREARVEKRGIWALQCPADLWGKKGEPRDYKNLQDGGKECGQP